MNILAVSEKHGLFIVAVHSKLWVFPLSPSTFEVGEEAHLIDLLNEGVCSLKL